MVKPGEVWNRIEAKSAPGDAFVKLILGLTRQTRGLV